jgi:hypothetical protein
MSELGMIMRDVDRRTGIASYLALHRRRRLIMVFSTKRRTMQERFVGG